MKEDLEERMEKEGWVKIPDEIVKEITTEHTRNTSEEIRKMRFAMEESYRKIWNTSIKRDRLQYVVPKTTDGFVPNYNILYY